MLFASKSLAQARVSTELRGPDRGEAGLLYRPIRGELGSFPRPIRRRFSVFPTVGPREAHFSRDFSLLVTLKYAKRGTPGAGKSVNGIRKHNRSTGAPHLSAKCVIILYFSAKILSSVRKLRNHPLLLLYYYYIKTNVVFIILKYNVDHVVRTGNETDI